MRRAYSTFTESTFEVLDFARCQRPDGSHYGISPGKKCRKGKEAGEKEKEEKTAKRGGKLFRAGSDIDFYAVEKAAEDWRQAAGLSAFPGTLDWKHDMVHALVHDFLGGHGKIGEWIGDGPKTPTPAEEIVVNLVHRAASLKGRGEDPRKTLSDEELTKYITRDIEFMFGRGNIGISNRKKYYDYEQDELGGRVWKGPAVDKFIKKYREMEATDGFDLLLDASYRSFTNAGEYFL